MAKQKRKRKNYSDDDESDDYIDDTFRGKATGSSSFKTKERKEVSLILAEEDQESEKKIKWSTITMGPSKFPPKHFCVICGCFGIYKCYKCYKCKPNSIIRYVCSLKCDIIHKEVDCCKPKNMFIW